MSNLVDVRVIAFGAAAVVDFLLAAALHFRLIPFLQADIIKLGRGGNEVPTEQFLAWAVPGFIGLGCLCLLLAAYFFVSHGKKAA